jgi:hypothetical protein
MLEIKEMNMKIATGRYLELYKMVSIEYLDEIGIVDMDKQCVSLFECL